LGQIAADFEHLEPIGVSTDPDCAVAELRVDIAFPGIGWFENMTVRIDGSWVRKTLILCHGVGSLVCG